MRVFIPKMNSGHIMIQNHENLPCCADFTKSYSKQKTINFFFFLQFTYNVSFLVFFFNCKMVVVSVGMCAELPPGAFRVSGRFRRRGWSQRVLLPQSPDLTCGCVILQCLR